MHFCSRPNYAEAGSDPAASDSSSTCASEASSSGSNCKCGGGEASSGSAGPPLAIPSYIRLVFTRCHPRTLAQQLVDAFATVHAMGLIDRGKTIRVL